MIQVGSQAWITHRALSANAGHKITTVLLITDGQPFPNVSRLWEALTKRLPGQPLLLSKHFSITKQSLSHRNSLSEALWFRPWISYLNRAFLRQNLCLSFQLCGVLSAKANRRWIPLPLKALFLKLKTSYFCRTRALLRGDKQSSGRLDQIEKSQSEGELGFRVPSWIWLAKLPELFYMRISQFAVGLRMDSAVSKSAASAERRNYHGL